MNKMSSLWTKHTDTGASAPPASKRRSVEEGAVDPRHAILDASALSLVACVMRHANAITEDRSQTDSQLPTMSADITKITAGKPVGFCRTNATYCGWPYQQTSIDLVINTYLRYGTLLSCCLQSLHTTASTARQLHPWTASHSRDKHRLCLSQEWN